MADENTNLLREIAALLKQQVEDRQKVMGDAFEKLPDPDHWKKSQEETGKRFQEARERAEKNHQELRAYQESVLSELRKISSLLEQIQRRSGGV